MAPARKRGANRAKANQLSLGDLVLAKVKGFPAWPAKISRPEDWERTPDPKKYFVQFFGTAEIAFVAPADIQAFTNEAKSKLSARCQGKTVKDFALAVKEICEAFEELQQKKASASGDDTDKTAPGDVASSIDGGEVELNDLNQTVGQKENISNEASGNELYGLERCSHGVGETETKDIKPSISCNSETGSSPVISIKKRGKTSSNSTCLPKKEVMLVSRPDNPFLSKEASSNRAGDGGEFHPDHANVETHLKILSASRSSPLLNHKGDSFSGHVDNSDSSPLLVVSVSAKPSAAGQRAKGVVTVSKRRRDGPVNVQKRTSSTVKSVKLDDPCSNNDLPDSEEHLKDGVESKVSPYDSARESSPDGLMSDSGVSNKKKVKALPKVKKHFMGVDNSLGLHEISKGTLDRSEVLGKDELFLLGDHRKKRSQFEHGKHKLAPTEDSRPAKRSKHVDVADGRTQKLPSKSRSESPCPAVIDDAEDKHGESKTSTSFMKAEDHLALNGETFSNGMNLPGDGAVLPLVKRRRRALEAMSDCTTQTVRGIMNKQPNSLKNDVSGSDNDSSPVMQVHSKWKSVCRFDDEDEKLRDLVDGEVSSNLNGPLFVSDSVDDTETHLESSSYDHLNIRNAEDDDFDSTRLEDNPSKVGESSNEVLNEALSPHMKKTEEKGAKRSMAAHVYCSPQKLECHKLSMKGGKPILASPKDSHGLATAIKQDEYKAIKPQSKASSTPTLRKAHAGSSKASIPVSDALNHLSKQTKGEKNMPTVAVTAEKSKVTSKTNLHVTAFAVSADQYLENNSLLPERVEVSSDKSVGSVVDSKFADSVTSMKHLIAAAQAKRRQAQSQSVSHESLIPPFISSASIDRGRSPSPPLVHPFMSVTSNVTQKDAKGLHSHTSLRSPPSHAHQFASQHHFDSEDHEERRVSSGHWASGGSLSGGTEAAVARDAFEGMIETLSRTKESIGRATRLAIDCAKYGIASEVVELLIQKLENEPSFHRRVDLFFLVDSITQYSHSHKGIVGASYIPTVQAALPRLLGAAAPPGAGARENRRQCLKVLRLWIERKILPESLLQHFMNDIGGSNDDIAAGYFLRRPSRAERAVDDPIREMEGILVDEYGSNATFQLPGLLSTNVFEDEDLSSSLCKETGIESLVEPSNALEEPETCAVTPSDRCHCILEDVDGELEMEDVSGSPKDGRTRGGNNSFELNLQRQTKDGILKSCSDNLSELPPLPPCSPPLPLESPPLPPPLPPSPPPPPPPSSPSPPPPPPPPLPLPSLLLSQPPTQAVPSTGPPSLLRPPSLPPQPSLQPQPSLPPQSLPPQSSLSMQLSIPSSSPPLTYRQSVPPEYCSDSLQISGSTHPGHVNTAMKSEMLPQQSPCFVAAGDGNTCDPSGFNSSRPFEYGHNDMYLNPQAQPKQQFQPINASYAQRPYPPGLPAETPPGHLYTKPTVQQHMQQLFHRPYSLPSLSNVQRQYVTDEKWSMPSSDFNPDNQHCMWLNGGRPPCSGPPFTQEGYFQPPVERSSTNNMGFQHPVHNPLASGASVPGDICL
ncbi:PREDICTED: ENHANCER OF AG-4 protein 2-like isoform X2 [Nelumbo nucifera]|uniref:ENHANCER OF AG-4 protein 2-like isoform X2 n=1 Tax=Nelumbo nucifera TaxID=4432 RepID=A0A1U7Z412_NELNU|nr:PREDICTED: ENHANCER OF AG-4 protein 2-like isoform X2 [Nelumbo nucifera]